MYGEESDGRSINLGDFSKKPFFGRTAELFGLFWAEWSYRVQVYSKVRAIYNTIEGFILVVPTR